MLDRDEDAALAEIEAALRRDDPEFVLMLERLERDPLGIADAAASLAEGALPAAPIIAMPAAHPAPGTLVVAEGPRRWVRVMATLIALLLALAITAGVTLLWGPDAGGLAGVLTIMAASLYGYQLLRGCPGRR